MTGTPRTTGVARALAPTGLRAVVLAAFGAVAGWQLLVLVTGVPAFILPPPGEVARALVEQHRALLAHTVVTTAEMLAGLALGSALGVASAVLLVLFRSARRWALPLMVVSQSLPVFALAPLLTLWFGYGMASKIVMATLIIYFPVVAATFDGLRHTPDAMLDLARTLGAGPWATLCRIRLPAALPSIASGVRVATSVAPIGAVVGEWVGSSRGLGYLMLNANGRMQTDVMFAALLCLCLVALALYALVSALLERCLYWQHDSSNARGDVARCRAAAPGTDRAVTDRTVTDHTVTDRRAFERSPPERSPPDRAVIDRAVAASAAAPSSDRDDST